MYGFLLHPHHFLFRQNPSTSRDSHETPQLSFDSTPRTTTFGPMCQLYAHIMPHTTTFEPTCQMYADITPRTITFEPTVRAIATHPYSTHPIKPTHTNLPLTPPFSDLILPTPTYVAMLAKMLLLSLFMCLLGTSALATTRSPRLRTGPDFCNLQRLSACQPSQHFEFEGGSIETWDVNNGQFQCVGVAPWQ